MKKIYQKITINKEQTTILDRKTSYNLSEPKNWQILCFFV